jgi:hypothetical protein
MQLDIKNHLLQTQTQSSQKKQGLLSYVVIHTPHPTIRFSILYTQEVTISVFPNTSGKI